MGTVLGTAVPPNRISVAFALVLTPLIFTGESRRSVCAGFVRRAVD